MVLHVSRRRVAAGLAALCAAVAVALAPTLVSGSGAAVSATAPDGIVVVGDSITARGTDDSGADDEGWWHMVAAHHGASVATFAQSGSGYLRPGSGCDGDRFIERVGAYSGPAPSFLIVEGGRNDWSRCADGEHVRAATSVIRGAVVEYLSMLAATVPASTRIVVLGPPWGPLQESERARVTAVIADAARSLGLQFVDMTGVLPASHVVDGVHPNRAGNEAIAARVIAALG